MQCLQTLARGKYHYLQANVFANNELFVFSFPMSLNDNKQRNRTFALITWSHLRLGNNNSIDEVLY